MVAPISVCLIVRNEERQLEACLKSIRPHVAEICVVDTGSTDSTPDIAHRYSDRFETYTACNDEQGRILDFSDARERSFGLATQPWVMWIDGDDEVRGAEHLAAIVAERDATRNGQPAQVMFPYEYSHDSAGRPTCVHYRERLMSPRSSFKWVNAVHEVVVCQVPGLSQSKDDRVTIVHHRDGTGKVIEPGRNLRILKEMYKRHGESDARHLYYLGLEYGNNGDVENALKFLTRYVELSGWEDEKYMACLRIIDHYMARPSYQEAIEWCMKAISVKETWAEAYFQMAKCYYFLAQSGIDSRRNWERCAHFARHGLSLPRTETVLFVNPMERDVEIYKYLNVALNSLGDVDGALKAVSAGLAVYPNEGSLSFNKQVYEKHLTHAAVDSGIDRLSELGVIDPKTRDFAKSVTRGSAKSTVIPGADGLLRADQSLSIVKSLWEQLLRHDELISARTLLSSVPWEIREHVDVAEMRRVTDSMTAHLRDEDVYWSMYTEYGADRESIPLPAEVLPDYSQYPRFVSTMRLLADRAKSGPVRFLDIGSYDGWLTNRAGMKGIQCWGVDCCESGVRIANDKAQEFGTGAKHAVVRFGKDSMPLDFPEQFDVVSLMEIYEHVPDTMQLLREAEKLVAPGGVLIVTTPEGSWCRGKEVSYHNKWDDVRPREHVRAPTAASLSADLKAVGLDDVRVEALAVSQRDHKIPIDGQATLFAVARRKSEIPVKNGRSLDITLYVGHGVEPWNPESIKVKGIGGSETAVAEMAKRLVALGHRVTVYGHCGNDLEGTFDGVIYRDASRYGPHECDVLLTSRRPEAVDDAFGVKAKATVCWVHDVHCGNALTHERALKIDRFLTLTNWHRDFFLSTYAYVHPDQMVVTRNGIDLSRFQYPPATRNPHRAVYSSSPDRGMQVAIQIWPKVRERIPDAELHVYYGFEVWEACSQGNPQQLSLIGSLKQMLKDGERFGVFYHGRVDQKTLAQEYMSSGVWAYPTWFYETSCITAMEAQAAGLAIVTSPIAALCETVGPRGTLVHGDWLSKEYQDKFVDEVVAAMQSTSEAKRQAVRDYAFDHFGWDSLAREWSEMLQGIVDDVSDDVVLKYKAANR